MAPDTSILFAGSSLAILAGLVLLVLAKRIVRGRAERRSRLRRGRWAIAIGTGPVQDIRMHSVRALAREAARSAAAQEDLLTLLAAGRLPPRDARRDPFQTALRRAGLQRALRRACRSRRADARGRALLLWARLGFEGRERAIAPLLVDPDPDVRAAATQALALCESEQAAFALLHALREGHLPPERIVERLSGPWAAGPLLSSLRDPDFERVRAWLAEALGLCRDPRAERPLIELLASGDEEQRIRACRALGRLEARSAGGPLARALVDPVPAVRAQAANALGEIRDVSRVHLLVPLMGDRSWWVRARAADALRALGPAGLAALRWCARSCVDPFARERAAEALRALAERRVKGKVVLVPGPRA